MYPQIGVLYYKAGARRFAVIMKREKRNTKLSVAYRIDGNQVRPNNERKRLVDVDRDVIRTLLE